MCLMAIDILWAVLIVSESHLRCFAFLIISPSGKVCAFRVQKGGEPRKQVFEKGFGIKYSIFHLFLAFLMTLGKKDHPSHCESTLSDLKSSEFAKIYMRKVLIPTLCYEERANVQVCLLYRVPSIVIMALLLYEM